MFQSRMDHIEDGGPIDHNEDDNYLSSSDILAVKSHSTIHSSCVCGDPGVRKPTALPACPVTAQHV